MELIDRYLDAVRLLLPRAQRTDIVNELRDELLSRQEEREEALGRPLSKLEVEALLHDFGHPVVVAGRYGRQQYLIGPDMFAVYALVLKIVLAAVWGSALIAGVVTLFAKPGSLGVALLDVFNIAWTGGFAAMGTVTTIFAVLERTSASRRIFADWRPSELPKIGRRRQRDTWQEHVGGIVVVGLFVLWWLGLIGTWQPVIVVRPHGTLTLAPAPVGSEVYWPILALALGLIGVHAMKLARRMPRLTRMVDMLFQGVTLVIAAYLLNAGRWVLVGGDGIPAVALPQIDKGVNIGIEVSLIVSVCAAVLSIGLDTWRLARGVDRDADPGARAIRG